jgi:hypothetical protein
LQTRFALLVITLMLVPGTALAQTQQYQVLKAKGSESFALPAEAANRSLDDPLVYNYDSPKGPNWILSITNALVYTPGNNSKVIVRILEPAPSEKFVELAMYGGDSMAYWVAANVPEEGYGRLYSQPVNGWSRENAVAISNVATAGLTATDGKRIILDRFDLNGFSIGSISVYGKDNASSAENAVSGEIRFDLLFGSFEESPLYLVPALVMVGVGGAVISLLFLKKRKPDD